MTDSVAMSLLQKRIRVSQRHNRHPTTLHGRSDLFRYQEVATAQDRAKIACPNGVSANRHWPESLPPSMMSSVPVM